MGRRPFRPSRAALLRRMERRLAAVLADAETARLTGDGEIDAIVADIRDAHARVTREIDNEGDTDA